MQRRITTMLQSQSKGLHLFPQSFFHRSRSLRSVIQYPFLLLFCNYLSCMDGSRIQIFAIIRKEIHIVRSICDAFFRLCPIHPSSYQSFDGRLNHFIIMAVKLLCATEIRAHDRPNVGPIDDFGFRSIWPVGLTELCLNICSDWTCFLWSDY